MNMHMIRNTGARKIVATRAVSLARKSFSCALLLFISPSFSTAGTSYGCVLYNQTGIPQNSHYLLS